MDFLNFRDLSVEEFDTKTFLEHATQQAKQRRYEDFLIVDVDAHHYETDSFARICDYIEDPVMRDQARYQGFGAQGLTSAAGGYQNLGGRVTAQQAPPPGEDTGHAASRRHADQALDGCDGRRHLGHVPDADALPRHHAAQGCRGRAGPRLQRLALRGGTGGRAAHHLDALSAVQRSRRLLQDDRGFRRQERRHRLHRRLAALPGGLRQRLRQSVARARRAQSDARLPRLLCLGRGSEPLAVQQIHRRAFAWASSGSTSSI